MTKVYFVRHAEAEGNFYRIFQGQSNGDVTPKGEKQLKALAERFKDVHLDAIYSSDLIRTLKTARAVNFYKGLSIITDQGLREIHGGDWENRPWDELPRLYPEQYRLWEQEPHLARLPGGESLEEVKDRLVLTVKSIVTANPDKEISIVTHGTALRCYTCFARRLPFSELNNVGWYDNTAVIPAVFDEYGEVVEMERADTSHLTPELSTFFGQEWWIGKGSGDQKRI